MLALSPNPETPFHPAPPRPPRTPALVRIGRGHPRRAAVEAFVRRVYGERYGADVRQFAPVLVACMARTARSSPPPATGRPMSGRCSWSATSTRRSRHCWPTRGLAPAREGIVEVGHLAAARAGEGRRLILLLGPHLAAQGFQWVVSTLTEELRHLFVRLGIAPLALGVADPAVLGAEAAHWGSYYDHRPVVLAGQIESGVAGAGAPPGRWS